VRQEGVATISALQERVLRDPACKERVINALTVKVTAMFRDPGFYRAFRRSVVPMLRTYPFLRLWHAGCSTGEEAYAMAILLEEEGLYARARIYATDMDGGVLRQAASGEFPLVSMRENTRNYLAAESRGCFSDYYVVRGDRVVVDPALRRNIVFGRHDLVREPSFNEFHVILCRNVLIYFAKALQNRVHRLLYESLGPLGYLGLGRSETIEFTPHAASYRAVPDGERIYRKIR
jgi:chemotaxis protein methyltransferase CheR